MYVVSDEDLRIRTFAIKLFGVVETKLDKYDVINVKGNSFIQQPRKQKYMPKSGIGVGH